MSIRMAVVVLAAATMPLSGCGTDAVEQDSQRIRQQLGRRTQVTDPVPPRIRGALKAASGGFVALLLIIVSVGCVSNSRGNANGFCTRFDSLWEDVTGDGPAIPEEELLRRVRALGDPGGVLSPSRARLESYIINGPTQGAVDETYYLRDVCDSYWASR